MTTNAHNGTWSGPNGHRRPQPLADRETRLDEARRALDRVARVATAMDGRLREDVETIREVLR